MFDQEALAVMGKALEEAGSNVAKAVEAFCKAMDRLTVMCDEAELTIHRFKEETIPFTWEELGKAAKEGRLGEVLKSGDYLPLTLKNGEDIGLEVGCDETGRFFFIFHNVMNDLHEMNEKWTNKGGWRDSNMRKYVREKVLPLLPDDLQAVIQPTKIVQVQNGVTLESEDKLFCLSATQVFGKNDLWSDYEPEDTQIDIFHDLHARIKNRSEDDYSYYWWLRSAGSSTAFRFVISSGAFNGSGAGNAGGVVLGFSLES